MGRIPFLSKQHSRHEIWKMFDSISKRYDLINHLLSFGIDIYWRRQLISYLPKISDISLLDLATGTGSQLLAIMKKAPTVTSALGIDLSAEMIRKGQKKIMDKPYAHQITLAKGDASAIALGNNAVHCVTLSFGIRNVVDITQVLRECYRVLLPKGRLLILEFSIPKSKIIRSLHLFYLRTILPTIAGWISQNKEAYRYLNQTIETFPHGKAFCKYLQKTGFQNIRAIPLTFGITTLYMGEKLA